MSRAEPSRRWGQNSSSKWGQCGLSHRDIPELTEKDCELTLVRAQRQRLMVGDIQSGQDSAGVRAFVGLTQVEFAAAPRAQASPY